MTEFESDWDQPEQQRRNGRCCLGCAIHEPEYMTPVGQLCNNCMQEGIAAGEFTEGDISDFPEEETASERAQANWQAHEESPLM